MMFSIKTFCREKAEISNMKDEVTSVPGYLNPLNDKLENCTF